MLRKKGTAAKPLTNEELRAATLALYVAEYAAATPAARAAGLAPAAAKRELRLRSGRATGIESVVDPVYFRENGRRNPLAEPKGKTEAARLRSLGSAIRKRRDSGGTLGRWESVAAAASVALGRTVTETAARNLYSRAGGDLAASYTGRGTRVAAPKTYGDATAELRGSARPEGK